MKNARIISRDGDTILEYERDQGGISGMLINKGLPASLVDAEKLVIRMEREFTAKSAKVRNATPETHSMKHRVRLRISADRAADGLRGQRERWEALKAACKV